MTITLRPAETADLPAILEIFNEAVLNTTASYEYQPNTLEQRAHWFEGHREQNLPVLVAVNEADEIVGWGSLSKFRDRIGYRFTVEHSVYVAVDQRGQGIGRCIMLGLIEAARALGKHVMVGGLDSSNQASIRLHQSLGFEQVGHFKQIGYKFDRWLDVVFYQLTL